MPVCIIALSQMRCLWLLFRVISLYTTIAPAIYCTANTRVLTDTDTDTDTETQRHRDTETQRHRDTETTDRP
jgi:hypothetical protein